MSLPAALAALASPTRSAHRNSKKPKCVSMAAHLKASSISVRLFPCGSIRRTAAAGTSSVSGANRTPANSNAGAVCRARGFFIALSASFVADCPPKGGHRRRPRGCGAAFPPAQLCTSPPNGTACPRQSRSLSAVVWRLVLLRIPPCRLRWVSAALGLSPLAPLPVQAKKGGRGGKPPLFHSVFPFWLGCLAPCGARFCPPPVPPWGERGVGFLLLIRQISAKRGFSALCALRRYLPKSSISTKYNLLRNSKKVSSAKQPTAAKDAKALFCIIEGRKKQPQFTS